MKHFFYTIVLVFLSGITTYAQKDIKTLSINDDLPESNTKMQGVDGKEHTISGTMGKKGVIVIFSCNTCPFVIGNENFPGWEVQYNSIYEQAEKLGFSVILVNSNEAKRENDDSMDNMKKRSEEKAYKMPYVIDKHSVVANAFGAKTTPHVFVFNTSNKLVYTGAIDNSTETNVETVTPYLINALTQLSTNQAVSESSTPPRGCSIKRVK